MASWPETLGHEVGDTEDGQPTDDVGPPVGDEVLLREPSRHQGAEVVDAALLPPRLQARGPLRISGPVPPHVDRRRRPLEHVEVLRPLAEVRNALHGGRTGPDDAHPLVLEPDQVPVGVTTRVGEVPAAGVEQVPTEGLDAGEARELRAAQGPDGGHDVARRHAVVTIGGHDPTGGLVVPAHPGDQSAEARVVVEAVAAGDRPTVLEDLGTVRVLLGRKVPDLLQEGQVDVRLDVALHSRIAVPVPGAPHVGARLHDANAPESGLAQARARQQSAESSAHDYDVDVVVERGPREVGIRIRIGQETGEFAGELAVLVVAVGSKALVAFLAVPGPDRVEVGGAHRRSHRAMSESIVTVETTAPSSSTIS